MIRAVVLLEDTTLPSVHAFAARRWTKVIEALQGNDVRVTLATLRHTTQVNAAMTERGIPTLSLGAVSWWQMPRAVARLTRLIRAEHLDIVHGHQVICALVAGAAARVARRGTAIYFRSHTSAGPKLRLASYLAARMCHLTMGGSRAVIEFAAREDRTPRHELRHVLNGVEELRPVSVDELFELKRSLEIPIEAPVVTSICRLRRDKGLDGLIQALDQAAPELQTTPHLVIAGEGPYKDELEGVARRSRRIRVHFVGHQDDVALFHALGSVVAVPSEREAFGLTAAEAMACSRPVLASAVGGLPEVVEDGVSGLLVPPDEVNALSKALIAMLRDPDRCAEMGRAGRSRYERMFTLTTMAEGWRAVWREYAPIPARPDPSL